MNCPECDARMDVVDSRAVRGNRTRRRYKCPECEHRVSTLEAIVTDFNNPGVDINEVLKQIAEHAIMSGGTFSSITGGFYPKAEDAYEDTLAELHKLYQQKETL